MPNRSVPSGGVRRNGPTAATRQVDAFKAANAGVDVKTESAGWSDYWPRLATQVAGQNAPDHDPRWTYRYLFEYARRGAIIPLDQYLGKSLDIADFGKPNLDSCSVEWQALRYQSRRELLRRRL